MGFKAHNDDCKNKIIDSVNDIEKNLKLLNQNQELNNLIENKNINNTNKINIVVLLISVLSLFISCYNLFKK